MKPNLSRIYKSKSWKTSSGFCCSIRWGSEKLGSAPQCDEGVLTAWIVSKHTGIHSLGTHSRLRHRHYKPLLASLQDSKVMKQVSGSKQDRKELRSHEAVTRNESKRWISCSHLVAFPSFSLTVKNLKELLKTSERSVGKSVFVKYLKMLFILKFCSRSILSKDLHQFERNKCHVWMICGRSSPYQICTTAVYTLCCHSGKIHARWK